ncbi:MAG: LPS export ABC transporter permease LptG [Deltaproteobacteria bacterium]|nr:LPS export ABC transporter permease LptG [Deltaproteobacteria bacterium]
MMTILDRYILKEFFIFFLLLLVSFTGLFLIVEFFERMRMFLSNHASFYQVAAYFFYRLPFMVSQIIPVAVLLASLITYSTLSRHSEIVAMKASGISIHRTAMPIIAAASLICFLAFFIGEFITPKANQKVDYIRYIEVQKKETRGTFKQNQIWYRGTNTIYNFKYFDPENNIIKGITINHLDRDFNLTMRIDAERAQWQDDGWLFYNLLIARYEEGGFPILERIDVRRINLPEKPEDFKIVQKDADKMGYMELKKFVRKIRSEGYDATKYTADMHGKIAFSFVSLILAVIGISFSLKPERSGGIALSIGIGIAIGFSYWIIHAFFMSLGRSGSLPPLLAAWLANIILSFAALILFARVKT